MPLFNEKLEKHISGFLIMTNTCLRIFTLISLKPELLLLFNEDNVSLNSSCFRRSLFSIALIVERWLIIWFSCLRAFKESVNLIPTKNLNLNFSAIIFLLVTSGLLIIKKLKNSHFWILDLSIMSLSIFQVFLIPFSYLFYLF